jgi:hypothetical protein
LRNTVLIPKRCLFILYLMVTLIATAVCIPAACASIPTSVASKEDHEVVVIPTLIVLFTQSDVKTANEKDIQAFHGQVAAIKEFFIQEAGEHLELELDYLQIDRRLALSEFGSPGDNRYHLFANSATPFLRQSGIDLSKYPLIIAFWAWSAQNEFGAAKAYGGAAEGPFLGSYVRGAYNSQGVFDGSYEVISRVGIHETLHNFDGLFGNSGMERFWHADHMAGLMSELLSERPGAFLPRHTDEEMMALAEKEKLRQYSFAWQDQMVFYRRMVERMTFDEWRALQWGYRKTINDLNRVTDDVYLEPLYRNMWVPEGDLVYVPVVLRDHLGNPVTSASVSLDDHTLAYQRYTHTDGSLVLYENGIYAGWVQPGVEGTLTIDAQLTKGQNLRSELTINRQKRAVIDAPIRVEWILDQEPVCKVPVSVTAEHLPLATNQSTAFGIDDQAQLNATLDYEPLQVESLSSNDFLVVIPSSAIVEPTSMEIMLEVESMHGYDQRPLLLEAKVSWTMRIRPLKAKVGTPAQIQVMLLSQGKLATDDFEVWAETSEGRISFEQQSPGRYIATWMPTKTGTCVMKVYSQKEGTAYVSLEELTAEVK